MHSFSIITSAVSLLALTSASPTPLPVELVTENAVFTGNSLTTPDVNVTEVLEARNIDDRQAPAFLHWQWYPIVFGNGVPVGGWADLTIASDGSYTFSGHFHDSGATSYNTAIVWAVKDSQGIGYTFTDTGRVHGTFEPGSRDHDWSKSGTSEEIRRRWPQIEAGWTYNAQANMDISLGWLVDAVKGAIGMVGAVFAIV